jgi:neutral ceramidase
VARSLYSPLALLINSAARMVPSPHQKECQGDKPILLNVGEALTPYPWVPRTTSVTLLRIGNFVIVCMPGEFTTMSGRRVREAVRAVVAPVWGPDVNVVLTSLANTYSSYVATYEEYQQQRYEGSSTLYGPHTLDAYIQAAVTLADAMAHGKQLVSTAAAAAPQDFTAKLLSLLPGVVVDSPPPGRSFGEAIKQPSGAYAPGQTVEASFWGANPRNNLRRGDTFLEVQRRDDASDGGNQWVTVHTDDDWSTKFEWARPASNALQSMLMSASSVVTVSWTVPERAAPGVYRIKYHGDAKNLMGKISAFEGVSQVFEVAGS